MLDRTNVLGVGVSAIDMMQALDMVEGWIGARQSNYVCEQRPGTERGPSQWQL